MSDTIPLEAGIEKRALSMTKGCYVGQEVIVRILHRGEGRVARRLMGLTFGAADGEGHGSAASRSGQHRSGTTGSDHVGQVTSTVVASPTLGQVIGLGYISEERWPSRAVSVEVVTGR